MPDTPAQPAGDDAGSLRHSNVLTSVTTVLLLVAIAAAVLLLAFLVGLYNPPV